jgi:hypothetical protein
MRGADRRWLIMVCIPVILEIIAPARAQGLSDDVPAEIVKLDPEAGHVVQVTWATAPNEEIAPELLVSGHRLEQVEVVVTFRASFADRLITWSAEKIQVESGTSVSIPVTIPSEVRWADQQNNFFTDLEMTVQSYDSEDRLVGTHGGPRVKLLWVEDGFDFLDPSQAKRLAPYGYVHEPPLGADLLLAEDGTTHLEFGPGL